jgi:hypothetical protein
MGKRAFEKKTLDIPATAIQLSAREIGGTHGDSLCIEYLYRF